MKKLEKFLTSRLFLTSLMILAQLLVLFVVVYVLSEYSIFINAAMIAISFIMVILILSDDSNPIFKIAWLIPMLTLPFFGWLLYFIFARRQVSKKTLDRLIECNDKTVNKLRQDADLTEKLAKESPLLLRRFKYLYETTNSAVYNNTETEYYPSGEAFFEAYLVELEKARSYIFLEYFIIEDGEMWSKILSVLTRKAAEGVKIRLLYDDLGTINVLPKDYVKTLSGLGIDAAIFNPYHASLDAFMNYRDHRKITVIDGITGFTGGLNLCDEYINRKERFGHWNDCAVKLCGDAVCQLSAMFLHLWYFTTGINENPDEYLVPHPAGSDGYVQAFSDGPLDSHLTGKNAYINVINGAAEYINICTPYLILDNEMISTLKLAAESGVDVRIITPHIPDKKIVHAVTRANYRPLLNAGVRIFEYLPGFMHSKTITSDEGFAIVGTVNFDYRSFYLHFEDGVVMHNSRAVTQVKDNFDSLLNSCTEITLDDYNSTPMHVVICRSVLKLFSPFM